MQDLLNRDTFFVKEHIGMFKAANNYDIFDLDSQQIIMHCREEKLGFFTKLLRFSDYKTMTPFHVEIRTPQGEKILSVKRGVTFFRSMVEVYDENDCLVGFFRQRMLSIGGKFDVLDNSQQLLCTLKGKWTSWDFKFLFEEQELAHVSKEWAGIGKELFTTADNYILQINENVGRDNLVRLLILAAVMVIDMVIKE